MYCGGVWSVGRRSKVGGVENVERAFHRHVAPPGVQIVPAAPASPLSAATLIPLRLASDSSIGQETGTES
jgi:hypothetical protein